MTILCLRPIVDGARGSNYVVKLSNVRLCVQVDAFSDRLAVDFCFSFYVARGSVGSTI